MTVMEEVLLLHVSESTNKSYYTCICPTSWVWVPVYFSSIERFGVKGDGGRVSTFGTADCDLSSQLHPGHRQDGAGVGTG